jgi:hypothetical protein
MTHFDYQAPADLYLGSDRQTAAAQGPRAFRTTAQALRFALEEAAPVSLKGASLEIGDVRYSKADMAALYRSADYPLPRKRPQRHQPARWQPASTQWAAG